MRYGQHGFLGAGWRPDPDRHPRRQVGAAGDPRGQVDRDVFLFLTKNYFIYMYFRIQTRTPKHVPSHPNGLCSVVQHIILIRVNY